MDLESEKVLRVIYKALDSLNESLPKDKRIEKSPHAPLFDGSGVIDSLGLTILIVALEQLIEEDLGARVTLVNDTVMSSDQSPFQNISTLADYISNLINIPKYV